MYHYLQSHCSSWNTWLVLAVCLGVVVIFNLLLMIFTAKYRSSMKLKAQKGRNPRPNLFEAVWAILMDTLLLAPPSLLIGYFITSRLIIPWNDGLPAGLVEPMMIAMSCGLGIPISASILRFLPFGMFRKLEKAIDGWFKPSPDSRGVRKEEKASQPRKAPRSIRRAAIRGRPGPKYNRG